MKRITVILYFSFFTLNPLFSQGWFPVGNGLPNGVTVLLTYDSVLYAGGTTVPDNGISQWNGSTWSTLGKGVNGNVYAIIIYNGKVYVGGEFDSAGGMPAKNIAVWDGHSWSPVGVGFSNDGLSAFAIYKGELYAGGYYSSAGGKPIPNIVRWNGTNWDSVGKGINWGDVECLQVYKGKLYVGGGFDSAGGIHAQGLATWDGTKWDSVNRWDSADLSPPNTYGLIGAFLVYDSLLYMGGTLQSMNWVCQWNDTNWKTPGFGTNFPVNALIEKNGNVYVGGQFDSAGHVSANYIAVWNGSSWSPLGSGMSGTDLTSGVNALAFYNGALYAAGDFDRVGGYNNVNNIAVWGDSTLSVSEITKNEPIMKIYPNPSSGKFNLVISGHPDSYQESVSSEMQVEVYNVLGQRVYPTPNLLPPAGGSVSFTFQMNLSAQPNGVYFYRVVAENGGLVGEGKVVIEK